MIEQDCTVRPAPTSQSSAIHLQCSRSKESTLAEVERYMKVCPVVILNHNDESQIELLLDVNTTMESRAPVVEELSFDLGRLG